MRALTMQIGPEQVLLNLQLRFRSGLSAADRQWLLNDWSKVFVTGTHWSSMFL
jgi:hypothetical protein